MGDQVYDLGNLDRISAAGDGPRGASRPAASGDVPTSTPTAVETSTDPRREVTRFIRRSPASSAGPGAAGPDVAGSLSLFVPGAGQLLHGQLQTGLFFLTALGFLAASGWAILNQLDGLSGTLPFLGLPAAGGVWMLGALYVFLATLHLVCVLSCRRPGFVGSVRGNPLLAGFASLLVPGWGQLLNGHRRRAGLFLGALWIVAGAWVLSVGFTVELLRSHGLVLPGALEILTSPAVRWTAPAVLWTLAVYDATTSALPAKG